MKTTQAEKVKQYNKLYPDYNITGIKKVNKDHLNSLDINGAKSLDDLYNSYSNAKYISYKEIIDTYKPEKIIGLEGNSMAYSITLIAENGDILWITRCNNYLVEKV